MSSTLQSMPIDAALENQGKHTMWINVLLILIPTVAGVIGQLMLKVGMSSMGALDINAAAIPSIIMKIATNPMIVVGLAIYMGGVFFWLLALNRLQLSYLYPFASLSYVLITIAAAVFLHEQIPSLRWVGLVVICVGVALVAKS